MAAEAHKKGFFMFRPKFLLLCLYVAAYIMLRMHNEIVFQQEYVSGRNGGVEVFRMARADPGIPYWRQQLWRALFSAGMVFEEEGQPVITRVKSLLGTAEERTGEGSLIDRAIEAGRNLLPNQAPRQQPQPQSYAPQQQQYQQRPQSYAQQAQAQPIEGLREGERMVYDPRVR